MKKYIVYLIPIIVNIMFCVLENVCNGWLGDGGATLVQIIANTIVLPICMVIIISKNLGKNIKKDILVMLLTYASLKIGELCELINYYIAVRNIDTETAMIFRTEWLFNSIALIIAYIIVRIVKWKCRKT